MCLISHVLLFFPLRATPSVRPVEIYRESYVPDMGQETWPVSAILLRLYQSVKMTAKSHYVPQ